MNQDYNPNFYFYNLDGNKSSFDTLAGELHRFGDKFLLLVLLKQILTHNIKIFIS